MTISVAKESVRLVLAPQVDITPLAEFTPGVRETLVGSDSDCILSRHRSRTGSQRLNAETAAFLRLFSEPRTIVEAVVEHSTRVAIDPFDLLEEAVDLVSAFLGQGILVDPASLGASSSGPRFNPGDSAFGLRVVESIHALADTEIYRCVDGRGRAVVLKYVLAHAPGYVRAALAQERRVLGRLADRVTQVPRVLASALDRPDPYLVMDLVDGQSFLAAMRQTPVEGVKRREVVRELLEAYHDLHEAGVLHGDVHPSNVILRSDGKVALVDFGGAFDADTPEDFQRIGLVHHYEPEVARAILDGRAAPLPTMPGEQYALANLVYLALTANMPIRLSLETNVALRQIAEEPPRPLLTWGLSSPAADRVLQRALAKRAADRFPSPESFGQALMQAIARDAIVRQTRLGSQSKHRSRTRASEERRVLERATRAFVRRYAVNSSQTRRGLREGPTASVYHGAAGIAYALLRVALIRNDPQVLVAADLWSLRAEHEAAKSRGFDGTKIGLNPADFAPSSLFHSRTGVYMVSALARHAAADSDGTSQAIDGFLEAARLGQRGRDPSETLRLAGDLSNGLAGVLVGAATLLPRATRPPQRARVLALGSELRAILESQVLQDRSTAPSPYLGFAHGMAGALFALLRWTDSAKDDASPFLEHALDGLAERASVVDGAASWPVFAAGPNASAWSGWCHGSAGYAILWAHAGRHFVNRGYEDLAVNAAEDAWRARDRMTASLCCGVGGAALALLQVGHLVDEARWRQRAEFAAAMAVQSMGSLPNRDSLFKGDVGLGLVAAEGLDPSGVFPFCGQ